MSDQTQGADAGLANGVAISVIIPVLNEEVVIRQCLASLTRQDLSQRAFEVIVIDNGSADHTLDVVRSFMSTLPLTVLEKPRCTISELRNTGASAAKGAHLAFLDSDCVAPPQWLRSALKLASASDGGVVGAFYTVPENSSWVARAWYADLPKFRKGAVSYVPAGTLILSRRVFLEVGGFDPAIPTSEDFELCQRVARAGFSVRAFPELTTIHLGTPQTLSGFYRKQLWHGSGVWTAFQRNMFDRAFLKTVLFTLCWLLCMVAALLAVPVALATHKSTVSLWAPALLILASAILAFRTAATRRRWPAVAQLTVLYFAYGVARALALLGVRPRKRPVPLAVSTFDSAANRAPVI